MRRLALSLLATSFVAGCYNFATPSYHPGDTRQVLVALSANGVAVESSVSGESACSDPGLVANALHLGVSTASDPTLRDVYLYTFRSARWDGSKDAVDACQGEYAAGTTGTSISRIDIPTYRAFGAGWPADLEAAIRAALTQASTEGV